MERYLITEQDIKKANTYLPLVQKVSLAKFCAQLCVETIATGIKDGDNVTALPDIGQRILIREEQFRIGVLVKEYLQRDYDPIHTEKGEPIPYLMSADDVDRWAHIETQIDRQKKNKDVADKCFDLMSDFNKFRRMMAVEIEQQMALKNDFVGRFTQAMSRGTDPETLQRLMEELKGIQAAAEAADNGTADK